MRIIALLAVLGSVAACARPNYAEHWPDRLSLSAGPQPGYAIKQVVEKQSPVTLVADDGSICRTSEERYAATKESGWIACAWTLPSLDSTEIARINR